MLFSIAMYMTADTLFVLPTATGQAKTHEVKAANMDGRDTLC